MRQAKFSTWGMESSKTKSLKAQILCDSWHLCFVIIPGKQTISITTSWTMFLLNYAGMIFLYFFNVNFCLFLKYFNCGLYNYWNNKIFWNIIVLILTYSKIQLCSVQYHQRSRPNFPSSVSSSLTGLLIILLCFRYVILWSFLCALVCQYFSPEDLEMCFSDIVVLKRFQWFASFSWSW